MAVVHEIDYVMLRSSGDYRYQKETDALTTAFMIDESIKSCGDERDCIYMRVL
jgi:hypothetical protein